VDTGHESSPGIPEIYRQQFSTISLSLEPHRYTLIPCQYDAKLIHILKCKYTFIYGAYVNIIIAYWWLTFKLWDLFS
jgi:hypothetical protein